MRFRCTLIALCLSVIAPQMRAVVVAYTADVAITGFSSNFVQDYLPGGSADPTDLTIEFAYETGGIGNEQSNGSYDYGFASDPLLYVSVGGLVNDPPASTDGVITLDSNPDYGTIVMTDQSTGSPNFELIINNSLTVGFQIFNYVKFWRHK